MPDFLSLFSLLFFCVKRKEAKENRFLRPSCFLSDIRFSDGCGRVFFPEKSILPPLPCRTSSRFFLFFSFVSKEKKQKKTAFLRPFASVQYTLFGWVWEGAFPGEKHSPTFAMPNFHSLFSLLFFCVKRKEAKENRIFAAFCFCPIHAFRVGVGGSFSRGKAFSHLCHAGLPLAFFSSFLLCQEKRSKRKPHFCGLLLLSNTRFSGGCGRVLFPGKSILPLLSRQIVSCCASVSNQNHRAHPPFPRRIAGKVPELPGRCARRRLQWG